METRDVMRSVVENIPDICQVGECLVHVLKGEDVGALLPTGFSGKVKRISCCRLAARNWGGQVA